MRTPLKKNKKAEVLNYILQDVNLTNSLFKRQVESKNYLKFIMIFDRKLFDINTLRTFVRGADLSNTFLIKEVQNIESICNENIEIYNNFLFDLRQKAIDRGVNKSLEINNEIIYLGCFDYLCLKFTGDTLITLPINEQIKNNEIFKVNNYGCFDSLFLAKECKKLSNFINENLKFDNSNVPSEKPNKKIPEKYYALYHWVLIEMGKEKAFEKNRITDKLDKPAIMKYGKEKHRLKTKGQVFYQTYRDIDITKKEAIARTFGKGYKEKLIEISNNDADVISYLKNYPN